jgi:methanogenesis imperfect marker protein 11
MENIIGIIDENEKEIELIEVNPCVGGLYWTFEHFRKSSSLIKNAWIVGSTVRYLVNTGMGKLYLSPPFTSAGIKDVVVENGKISVTYRGMGGGGVGATIYRAKAKDVIDYEISEYGGGQWSEGTITIPARKRVLIGIDDTDDPKQGATWSLAYNIGKHLDDFKTRFVSHGIVQLYPVEEKTGNCVSVVLEFAVIRNTVNELFRKLKKLVKESSFSEETGLVGVRRFYVDSMESYSYQCKSRRVSKEEALEALASVDGKILLNGRGVIGAVAALPYFRNPAKGVRIDG